MQTDFSIPKMLTNHFTNNPSSIKSMCKYSAESKQVQSTENSASEMKEKKKKKRLIYFCVVCDND